MSNLYDKLLSTSDIKPNLKNFEERINKIDQKRISRRASKNHEDNFEEEPKRPLKFPTFTLINERTFSNIKMNSAHISRFPSAKEEPEIKGEISFFGELHKANENNEKNKIKKQNEIGLMLLPKFPTPIIQEKRKIPRVRSGNRDKYYNKGLFNPEFPIISEESEIPIIFDSSDIFNVEREKPKVEQEKDEEIKQEKLKGDDFNLDFVDSIDESSKYAKPISSMPFSVYNHAEVAKNLFYVDTDPTSIEDFHHPKIDTKSLIGKRISVVYKPDTNEVTDDDENVQLNSIEDLSGVKGKIILVEHTEENPPYILNVGMHSLLNKFWHKKNEDDIPKVHDSRTFVIKENATSPFLFDIPKSQDFYAITNSLFNESVAPHKVRDEDFLLVRNPEYPQKVYIRKVNECFCAGFIQPKMSVFYPDGKEYMEFIKKFIQAIFINVSRGTDHSKGKGGVIIADFQKKYFPSINKKVILDSIKKFATHKKVKGDVYWTASCPNKLDEKFEDLGIKPEEVCAYQSMVIGLKKLRRSGVHYITRDDRLGFFLKKLSGKNTKAVGAMIHNEIRKTPWFRTEKSFIEYKGVDLKKNRKVFKPKVKIVKLKREELIKLLKENGVKDSEIEGVKNGTLRKYLNKILTTQAENGITNKNVNTYYHQSFKSRKSLIKERYQSAFNNNLDFITNQNEDDKESNDNTNDLDFDFGDMFKNIDDENGEEEDDNNEAFEETTVLNDKEDPPELVPYGVATHKFNVNWEEVGFEKGKTRKVAKVINVSYDKETKKPKVTVSWIRSEHQIKKLMKRKSLVNIGYKKEKSLEDDIELDVLKKQKEELLSKKKNLKRTKGNTNDFIQKEHQIMLSNSVNSSMSFILGKNVIQRIKNASARYIKFIQKEKSVKRERKLNSDYDDDNED